AMQLIEGRTLVALIRTLRGAGLTALALVSATVMILPLDHETDRTTSGPFGTLSPFLFFRCISSTRRSYSLSYPTTIPPAVAGKHKNLHCAPEIWRLDHRRADCT